MSSSDDEDWGEFATDPPVVADQTNDGPLQQHSFGEFTTTSSDDITNNNAEKQVKGEGERNEEEVEEWGEFDVSTIEDNTANINVAKPI
jgi:hypothetical protein